ncbi:MAG TPA: flagellar basal body P-ring formation chaperone FlgA [Woeseiaceae bacterium]|nr:flagellar basal body P-ring formation chaperone FlgA [Woeseiaceae bacterium]
MNKGKSVSKLTASNLKCHKFDTDWRVGLVLGISLLLAVSSASAGAWQDPVIIAATAENYLRERLAGPAHGSDDAAGKTTLSAGALDRRLKLARCDQPLTGFIREGTKISARTIVGVRCNGSKPWKVYVPVEMTAEMTVWVASKPLPRGHILDRSDMVAETRNVSYQSEGYFSKEEMLVGQRLRNSILAGRAFEPHLVEADNVIRRGQTVVLAVLMGDINIRMSGKALSDGAINQRIRVENQNSGRIVEGIVRSRELVEVLMPVQGNFHQSTPKVSPKLADTGFNNNDS